MPQKLQIIIDTREQQPWDFRSIPGCMQKVATLRSGDYSLLGHELEISIERKSLDDLVATMTRGRKRFEAECERLAAMSYAVVVIESTMRHLTQGIYTSKANPQSVLGGIISLQLDYGIPFVFAGGRADSANYAYRWFMNVIKRIEK